MNDLVYIGYISGPFGLKGDLKIISDLNHLDKILAVNNKVIIDDKEYKIKKYQFHKHHLILLENYENINLIENLIKKDIYFERSKLLLKENEYLYSDLLKCKIIDNKEEVGIVEEVLKNKNTCYIKCENLIIPLIDKYFEKVDIQHKIVYVKSSKELLL